MAESKFDRPKSFFQGAAEIAFSAEQMFFFVTYFVAGLAAASVGAWGLAAVAFALSVAPARATWHEASSSYKHLAHATRRGH